MVRLLVSASNVDVNASDRSTKYTALTAAVSTGSLPIVRLLCSQANIDVDEPDGEGRVPLREACMGDHGGIVSHLLDRGARVHAEVLTSTTAHPNRANEGELGTEWIASTAIKYRALHAFEAMWHSPSFRWDPWPYALGDLVHGLRWGIADSDKGRADRAALESMLQLAVDEAQAPAPRVRLSVFLPNGSTLAHYLEYLSLRQPLLSAVWECVKDIANVRSNDRANHTPLEQALTTSISRYLVERLLAIPHVDVWCPGLDGSLPLHCLSVASRDRFRSHAFI